VKTANVAALSGMKLRLRLSDGSSLAGDLELAGQDAGTDKAGAYERTRYRLNAGATTQPARKESVSAVLEMRHYLRPDVLIASLDYGAVAGGIRRRSTHHEFGRLCARHGLEAA
jgi:hypothetical protein